MHSDIMKGIALGRWIGSGALIGLFGVGYTSGFCSGFKQGSLEKFYEANISIT